MGKAHGQRLVEQLVAHVAVKRTWSEESTSLVFTRKGNAAL
jgi:hypothetical protein